MITDRVVVDFFSERVHAMSFLEVCPHVFDSDFLCQIYVVIESFRLYTVAICIYRELREHSLCHVNMLRAFYLLVSV